MVEMRKLFLLGAAFVVSLVLLLTACKKDEANNNGNNSGNTENPGGGSGGGSDSGGGGTVAGYVDLGLPSGTKWNSANETGGYAGFFTYDEAISAFGDKLPTKEQCDELRGYCTWEWQVNGGYKVTGQNGNSIVLPASGYRTCDGYVGGVGACGNYWSSTPYGSEHAWLLDFYLDYVRMHYDCRCLGFAVRLVQD